MPRIRLGRQEIEKPLSKEDWFEWLKDQIPNNAKSGDQVLVISNIVHRGRSSTGCVRGSENDRLETEFTLGVLGDEPFVRPENEGLFPVICTHNGYARAWDVNGVTLYGGHISFSVTSMLDIDPRQKLPEPQRLRFWMNRGRIHDYAEHAAKAPEVYPIHIVVGSDAVQEFCVSFGNHMMASYLASLRVLSLQAELRSELQELDLKQREEHALITRSSWQAFCNLDAKVKGIMQRRGAWMEDGALTVCDSESDAVFISWAEMNKRSEESRRLVRLLEHAKVLRMHEIPHSLKLATPGESLNVPVFIKALSEILFQEKVS